MLLGLIIQNKHCIYRGILTLFIIGVLGCSPIYESHLSESYVKQAWLPYIKNNNITKDEIITLLGEPTAYFNNGKILAYRVIVIETSPDTSLILVIRESIEELDFLSNLDEFEYSRKTQIRTEYDLILAFDNNNILKNHSLIKVRR